jgi:hypothetical protein
MATPAKKRQVSVANVKILICMALSHSLVSAGLTGEAAERFNHSYVENAPLVGGAFTKELESITAIAQRLVHE